MADQGQVAFDSFDSCMISAVVTPQEKQRVFKTIMNRAPVTEVASKMLFKIAIDARF
ncbi:hypothetical protein [Mesotoga infera]|uniref:hypothetical protein n=1 Tax=Mesotoga infera TaxID=1236046 RepID=UPI00146AD0E4|nr:hypothetical protein [Mesotoga infera]